MDSHSNGKLLRENNIGKVCTSCNLRHVIAKDCPAFGKKCHRCNKLNHFSAACRTKLRKFSKIMANSASSEEFNSRVIESSLIVEMKKDSSSVEAKTSDRNDKSDTGNSENQGFDKIIEPIDPMDTPGVSVESGVRKINNSSRIKNKKEKETSSDEKKSKVTEVDPQISKEKEMINWINKELKTKHEKFEDLSDGKTIRSLLDVSMGLAKDWHSSDSVWNDIKLMISIQDIDIDEDKLEAGQRSEVEKLIDWLKKERKMKSRDKMKRKNVS